ncbi:unnamed protein product [Camellia sinensis]
MNSPISFPPFVSYDLKSLIPNPLNKKSPKYDTISLSFTTANSDSGSSSSKEGRQRAASNDGEQRVTTASSGDYHCRRHHLLPHHPLSLLLFFSLIFIGRLLRLLHSRHRFQNPNHTFNLLQSLHNPYVRIQSLHFPQLFQNFSLHRTTTGLVRMAISNRLIAMRKIRRRGTLMRQK